MRKLIFSILLCVVTSVAVAQEDTSAVDSSLVEAHWGAGISVIFTEASTLGYRAEVTRTKDKFTFGLGIEYAEASYSTTEVYTGSFSTVKNFDKHIDFVQVGFFGDYFPLNSNSMNPYVSMEAGSLFTGNEFAFPLSASLGIQIKMKLANGNSLNPFVQYGYQYVIKPVSNLDQNGFVLKIGLRYVF